MIKKLLAILLSAVIFSISISNQSFAATAAVTKQESKDDVLRQSVMDVVYLLKELLESKYSNKEQEVKDLIVQKGYDYNLTMASFYDQPNPIKDADFLKYLSAYMSCKRYAEENSLSIMQLSQIPFIDYEINEYESEEYIPTLIDTYMQDEYVLDEYWRVTGNEYITQPVDVNVYEPQENGRFKKTDSTQTIVPDTKQITYAEVTLSVITPEELFNYLDIEQELVGDDYERRIAIMKQVVTNESILSTIAINLPSINLTSIDLSQYEPMLEGLDDVRKTIVTTALSLLGKVPYEWGGKADKPGYDTKWWSYNSENGLQHGLDCSGFVQWVYLTSGFDRGVLNQVVSTSAILKSNMKKVNKSELKPGDVGVTNRPNGRINHCGVYLGDDLWIHCSSSFKTVVVSKVDFTSFYSTVDSATNIDKSIVEAYLNTLNRGINDSNNISNNVDSNNSLYYTHNYSNAEVMLLSKLIYNEARGEGINGWIAVAEVALNRVNSDKFPNTLNDVIYQSEQFSGSENIDSLMPTEDIVTVAQMVLAGNLKVLNNENVLYFRNPMITNKVPSTTPQDWDEHRWYTAINNHAFYLQ